MVVGKVIAISTCIPCFIAAICFWNAGFHYAKKKQEQVKEADEAIEKMSVYHVDMRTQSIANMLNMKSLRGLSVYSYRRKDSKFAPYLTSDEPKELLKSS